MLPRRRSIHGPDLARSNPRHRIVRQRGGPPACRRPLLPRRHAICGGVSRRRCRSRRLPPMVVCRWFLARYRRNRFYALASAAGRASPGLLTCNRVQPLRLPCRAQHCLLSSRRVRRPGIGCATSFRRTFAILTHGALIWRRSGSSLPSRPSWAPRPRPGRAHPCGSVRRAAASVPRQADGEAAARSLADAIRLEGKQPR